MLSLLPPALLTRTLLRNVLEAADLGPFYRSFSRYGVTAAGRFGSQQDALLELLELTEDDLRAIGLDDRQRARFGAQRAALAARRRREVDSGRVQQQNRSFNSPLAALMHTARLGAQQVGWALARLGVASLRDLHELTDADLAEAGVRRASHSSPSLLRPASRLGRP